MLMLIGANLPSLDAATEWLNGMVENASLLSCPLLVQFWAISCPICKFNMPRLQEQECLTRRAALRKLGFGAGLSAFMLLGVDDLARMVGTKMAQTARDNKTAEQIAKEFQSAGVSLAEGNASGPPCPPLWCDCVQTCTGDDGRTLTQCLANCNAQNNPPIPCQCA